jgi:hypothetical protein
MVLLYHWFCAVALYENKLSFGFPFHIMSDQIEAG